MSKPSLVFMGTADFGIPTLEKLISENFEIRSVVTVPDKPGGRGKQPKPSPIKQKAQEHSLPILQPEKLKEASFRESLRELEVDLFVVVAFRILPPEVFRIAKMGCMNLHASLLPYYRGAAPIQRAIMNGEEKTGVTSFIIDEKMDTGHILLQEEAKIGPNETAGEVHDKLSDIGANLVLDSVKGYADGQIEPKPQPEGDYQKAPKITKEDTVINWELPADKIHNQIRGLSPIPGAWCWFGNKRLKILRTEIDKSVSIPPGKIRVFSDGPPAVGTADEKSLRLKEVKPEGKQKQSGQAFARGYDLEDKELISA